MPTRLFRISSTRLSRSLARLPSLLDYPSKSLLWPRYPCSIRMKQVWASFSAFARHYLRNRFFFLFLQVLRCFTSLGRLPLPMDSAMNDNLFRLPGFPIRISTDQCLIGDSPWLFAAIHVLLSLLTPRHPSYALSNLSSSGFPKISRKTQLYAIPIFNDLGADRLRTGDLRLAKPTLSQLSYGPSRNLGPGWI